MAGILRDRTINMTEQEWDDVNRVHLKGHYCTMRPAAAHMRENKSARIINFSSNSAPAAPVSRTMQPRRPDPGATFSSANALQKYNITVNAIMPGAATRMTDTVPQTRMAGGGFPQSAQAEGTPRDPSNVAPIVCFLASDHAANVTGECFGASGYRIMRYTHMVPDKIIYSQGPWDIEKLPDLLKGTLLSDLAPPRM